MFGCKEFIVFCACFFIGFGLECGINLNGSETQFRELTKQCTIGNRSVVTDKPQTSSSEEEVDDDYDGKENSKQVSFSRKQGSFKFFLSVVGRQTLDDENVNSTTITPPSSETGVKQQCVVQCVFERLGLVSRSLPTTSAFLRQF